MSIKIALHCKVLRESAQNVIMKYLYSENIIIIKLRQREINFDKENRYNFTNNSQSSLRKIFLVNEKKPRL